MNEFVRVFETTVAHPELDVSFEVFTVSGPEFAGASDRERAHLWLEQIGLEVKSSWDAAGNLFSLAPRLVDEASKAGARLTGETSEGEEFPSSGDPRLRHLADYVVFAPILPFEGSPLELQSIGGIAAQAGVGAAIGLAVGFGSPLIFVTVPGGIILVKIASHVGDAAGEVLKSHILRFAYKRKTTHKASRTSTRRNPGINSLSHSPHGGIASL